MIEQERPPNGCARCCEQLAAAGRRVALYIPDALAPEIHRALDRGHALQDLLYEAGQRYAAARKRERRALR